LARGLHDEVLNELASMAMRAGDLQVTPDVIESYQLLTTYLRSVINDLRPAMLAYGLGPALNELIDQLSDRVVEEIVFQIDLPGNDVRYAPQVEQHVFRIVEQACENALRHAQAKIIRIDGDLEADRIRLVVKDDGRGSSILEKIDLNVLLIAGHYGLVGMFERAAIIGAELRFRSDPEIGTLVEITWGNEPEQIL
jgi:two-component system sensor histidine kinase DegS